jgi:hypothetical protein
MPNTQTPGLDISNMPEDSGSAQTNQNIPTESATVSVGKNKYTPAQTEDILAKMQQYVDERESPFARFASGLSAGMATARGPAALATYQKQKLEEDKQVMDYRQQMAQLASAPELAKALRNANLSLINGSGSSVTGNAADAFKFLNPATKATYLKINSFDPKAAEDYLNKIVAKNQEIESNFLANPSSYDQKKVWNADKNQYELVNPIQQRTQLPQMRAQIQGQQGQPTVSGGAPVFADPSIKIISGERTLEKDKELYAASVAAGTPGIQPNGLPVAKPGESMHEKGLGAAYDIDPKTLTKTGRLELAQKGYYQPYGIDSPHWERIPTSAVVSGAGQPQAGAMQVSAPAAQAPAIPAVKPIAQFPQTLKASTPLPGSSLPAFQQADIAEATAKSAAKEESDILAKGAGERGAALEKNFGKATSNIASAERLLNLSINKPHIFNLEAGPMTGSGGVYALAKLAHLGNKEEAAKFTAERSLKDRPQDLADWQNLSSASKELGINYASEAFTGSRLGIGLENMAQSAKGVGPEFSAEANRMSLEKIIAANKVNEGLGKMWKNYKDVTGSNAKFNDFENLPEVAKFKKTAEEELSKKFPDDFKEKPRSGADISELAKKQFGGYDDKTYDYRINPDTGKLQRKPK